MQFRSKESMEEARGKHVAPAIDQLSFSCPHCGALTRQFWFSVHADPLQADEKPFAANAETFKTLTLNDGDEHQRDRKLKWVERMASGRPFLEGRLEKFFSPSLRESDSVTARENGQMERASHGTEGLFRS